MLAECWLSHAVKSKSESLRMDIVSLSLGLRSAWIVWLSWCLACLFCHLFYSPERLKLRDFPWISLLFYSNGTHWTDLSQWTSSLLTRLETLRLSFSFSLSCGMDWLEIEGLGCLLFSMLIQRYSALIKSELISVDFSEWLWIGLASWSLLSSLNSSHTD